MSSKTWKEKLAEIQDGWKHVIFKNDEVEMLAFKRASICAGCDKNINNICAECGCILIAKTRSIKETNKCPLNKWEL